MRHNPGFLQLVHMAKQSIRECTVQDVKARIDRGESFHFIDIREDHEVAGGYAKGAIHLGRGILERDIETRIPDKHVLLVLYCGGGYRSALAADNLQKMGFSNVESMDGGIKAWREAGYPMEGKT
ncbi:MAG: rhodanese-like domain-containing protein [Nitrospirae bacterium]|nr:rhodanese-like domain-containing protein [Nitrospirota bacterium]